MSRSQRQAGLQSAEGRLLVLPDTFKDISDRSVRLQFSKVARKTKILLLITVTSTYFAVGTMTLEKVGPIIGLLTFLGAIIMAVVKLYNRVDKLEWEWHQHVDYTKEKKELEEERVKLLNEVASRTQKAEYVLDTVKSQLDRIITSHKE